MTTVFVRQGHCAFDPEATDTYPNTDLAVERLGDPLGLKLGDFTDAARPKRV